MNNRSINFQQDMDRVRATYDAVATRYADVMVNELDERPIERGLLDEVVRASRWCGGFASGVAGAANSLPESDSSFSSSSATVRSSMCWKRRWGSLRRQRVTRRSTSGGIWPESSWS